ncbi:MAG: protein kinase family protein [Candidatus Aminicenantes bacterium]|nr:protein kinase family protein [Candidatus Aminicenantes bacterium]
MKLKNGKINLYRNHRKNFIKYKHATYKLARAENKNNGSNSFIFLLKDPNKELPDSIIKFCRYYEGEKDNKRLERFKREIAALKKAKKNNSKNIIRYCWDYNCEIDGKKFVYYVMEKAESNLRDYLLDNPLDNQEKLKLSRDILNGLNELHKIGIYHRDIKPENILFTNDGFKIADLGLLSYRDDDFDGINEKIGPFGWISPEVMSKSLTQNKDTEFEFDCKIDDKSDVFQLGKLFWYIFQGNIPIGQIQQDDFKPQIEEIFDLIKRMIQYAKDRRPKMENVLLEFRKLEKQYAI